MVHSSETAYDNYWQVMKSAGQATTRKELLSIIEANTDAFDVGALATMQLLTEGKLHMESAFTTLDSAKAIGAKQLIYRAAAARAHVQFDPIWSRPDSRPVALYLKSKPHSTAIISFHFIGRDRLAIFVASNSPTGSGIQGLGGVYYDCIWLDGLSDKVYSSLEAYAASVNLGTPNHSLTKKFFDFIGSALFMLLSRPNPDEIIFIPHKLMHILPLHALSLELAGKRVYLLEMVQTIRYASSFQELNYNNMSFGGRISNQKLNSRFLSIQDTKANISGGDLERKCIEVYRELLEPQGVKLDIVSNLKQMPKSQSDYLWVNWSSQSASSMNDWEHSFLRIDQECLSAYTIATEWQYDQQPTVILSACESSVDISSDIHLDEYCGLDLALRIAGAKAVVAPLWSVDNLVALLTVLTVPAWWFQGGMLPAHSVTALQKALLGGTWKQFLLRKEQLNRLPHAMAKSMSEVQGPFWDIPDNAFIDEDSWAAFRTHGG